MDADGRIPPCGPGVAAEFRLTERSMWHEEDPPEPVRERHQVASSWALVAVVLFAAAAWSGPHYLALVAEAIFGPAQTISPRENGLSPRGSMARCSAAWRESPRESNAGREHGAHDARPPSPESPDCEGWFDVPGPALVVEWEALR